MLLAALPGNTLPSRDRGFILMLMNPLSIQQNCLRDTSSSGVQPSSCMTVTIPFFMTDGKSPSMTVKRHIWGASVCTKVSQSLVLCLFFFSMCSISAQEMDNPCSCVHHVVSIPHSINTVRVLPTCCHSKKGSFLTNTQLSPVYTKFVFVTINRETFKS